jgi:hypothetical protein
MYRDGCIKKYVFINNLLNDINIDNFFINIVTSFQDGIILVRYLTVGGAHVYPIFYH